MNSLLFTFLVAMTPVIELRGAIPLAVARGVPPLSAACVAVLGNLLPVPFILLFIRRTLDWLNARSARCRNGVIMRRAALPICANCPPSKNACSTGRLVRVRNAMARSAPIEEAMISARRFTPCARRNSSTCRTSSALPAYFCPAQ